MDMLSRRSISRALVVLVAFALSGVADASWYWPFGSDEKKDQPRLSELMEGASIAMDNASDLAMEGKVEEAVAEYRKALAELDRVEMENPERAATPEFATVRNKRAIVNASIDSLYLSQARENAKAVAVTDTTELEKKFAERKAERMAASMTEKQAKKDTRPKLESQFETYMEGERKHAKKVEREAARAKTERTIEELLAKDPNSRKARLMQAGEMIRAGDLDGAKEKLGGLLEERPDDVSALNMLAICQATAGDHQAARNTLDAAIKANPNDYHAYYNMVRLVMQTSGKKSAAKRYYETGRAVGGPEDPKLEKLFK
jgi:tetratricopeptide (TPR) repeat protein